MLKHLTRLLPCCAVLCGAAALSAEEPPIVWTQPPRFDATIEGLGLPQLPGVQNQTIYDPARNPPIQTIDGQPTEQGWLNHHTNIVLLDNHIIVTWTSHLVDENAPGQRVLARLGRFSDTGDITWSPNITELVAPPVPMKPRGEDTNPDAIDGPYIVGRLNLIGGRLYFKGSVRAYDGWTDQAQFGGDQAQPVPADHYQLQRNRDTHFAYDIRRDLKMRFIQSWTIRDDQLVPESPLYLVAPLIDTIEVTPGRFKPVVELNASYLGARSIDTAPQRIRDAYAAEPDLTFERTARFAPGTSHLAADGRNGLSHWAEFQRPDGKWVVVRDNLENPGFYYAAVKEHLEDDYPPAGRTNLFGDVNPEAGELPDGRVWLLGNDRQRVHLYLTLSDDGIHFDRTWLLYRARIPLKPGLGKTDRPNGPQYPIAFVRGEHLLVFYSIGKQRIGMSDVPLDRLAKP